MQDDDVVKQSKSAYKQWCVQWREHSKIHSKEKMHSFKELENIGLGKAVLCIANGYSFEKNWKVIKENQGKCDIVVCDKTLGHALRLGIKPTYCVVCDANVDYEKYLEPWKDQLSDITVFTNVCANTKWTKDINWKKKYFFVNKDACSYEKEFMALSKCPNVIPAATNVSNALVVLLTQSDNGGRKNFFGYDKILLIGFDYSWRHNESYYAFNADGNGKHNYMRHINHMDCERNLCYTSNNLAFSAQWLQKYIGVFRLPVVQCGEGSLLGITKGDLAKQMQYSFKKEDSKLVCDLHSSKAEWRKLLKETDKKLSKISLDHYLSYQASL